MPYVFQFGEVLRYWPSLVTGVAMTLGFALVAMALSLAVGVLGAVARRSRSRTVRGAVLAYVETIRNTPLLVQLFVLFFGLPSLGLRLDPMVAALVGLVVYNGAFVTEIVGAGIQAVPRGQFEAGLSLGMSRRQVYQHVILVPALAKVYPALVSQFVLLMLGTSVVSAIGVDELTSVAGQIQSDTFRSVEVYLVCIAIYLLLTLTLRAAALGAAAWVFPFRRAAPHQRV